MSVFGQLLHVWIHEQFALAFTSNLPLPKSKQALESEKNSFKLKRATPQWTDSIINFNPLARRKYDRLHLGIGRQSWRQIVADINPMRSIAPIVETQFYSMYTT